MEFTGGQRAFVPGEERVGALLGGAVGAGGEPRLARIVADREQSLAQLL
jgi:hypothetical protein